MSYNIAVHHYHHHQQPGARSTTAKFSITTHNHPPREPSTTQPHEMLIQCVSQGARCLPFSVVVPTGDRWSIWWWDERPSTHPHTGSQSSHEGRGRRAAREGVVEEVIVVGLSSRWSCSQGVVLVLVLVLASIVYYCNKNNNSNE